MTIHNRAMNYRLSNLEAAFRCQHTAHTRLNKRVLDAIAAATDAVRDAFLRHQLAASGTDSCRDLECMIYAYLLASNPDMVEELEHVEAIGDTIGL